MIEVALSVQFEPILALRSAHLGLLWQEFRLEFPRIEDHAPLEQAIETFGVRRRPKLGLKLVPMESPPLARSWFLNEPRTELIQIQQDRFIHNWRKVGEGIKAEEDYPRYEFIRERFSNELQVLERFLTENKLGSFVPNQCEVTYVNHIMAGAGWEHHGQISEVFSPWSSGYSESFPLEMEDSGFSLRYIIPDKEKKPLGRLHISLQPAFDKTDESPMFVLTLTARGKPFFEATGGVLEFLDSAREYIVLAFAAITTPKMHKVWRRIDDQKSNRNS